MQLQRSKKLEESGVLGEVTSDSTDKRDHELAANRLDECKRLPVVDSGVCPMLCSDGFCDDALRRKAAQTREVCIQGGYVLNGNSILLRFMKDMLRGTRFVSSNDSTCLSAASSTRESSCCGLIWLEHLGGKPLSVAVSRASEGHGVALLVAAASAYRLGGNFTSAGPRGLQEVVLTQTTQYKSLCLAEAQAAQQGIGAPLRTKPAASLDGRAWRCCIPEEGALLSPHVEVFRSDAEHGYQFLSQPVHLCGVVSLAMPNRSGHSRAEEPMDAPELRKEYVALLRIKFSAAVAAVALAGASCLVATDVGCSASGGKASDVGDALRAALFAVPVPALREVCLVGSADFIAAAQAAVVPLRSGPLPDGDDEGVTGFANEPTASIVDHGPASVPAAVAAQNPENLLSTYGGGKDDQKVETLREASGNDGAVQVALGTLPDAQHLALSSVIFDSSSAPCSHMNHAEREKLFLDQTPTSCVCNELGITLA